MIIEVRAKNCYVFGENITFSMKADMRNKRFGANVHKENNFNVLTGETGAGKTLIIDSLGIISGDRFSKDMIRKGENYSFVELNLFLPNNKNSDNGSIIVSREIYENGRNTCKINGRLVTVNELREFMNNIIDIHGQNDNQTLMEKQTLMENLQK